MSHLSNSESDHELMSSPLAAENLNTKPFAMIHQFPPEVLKTLQAAGIDPPLFEQTKAMYDRMMGPDTTPPLEALLQLRKNLARLAALQAAKIQRPVDTGSPSSVSSERSQSPSTHEVSSDAGSDTHLSDGPVMFGSEPPSAIRQHPFRGATTMGESWDKFVNPCLCKAIVSNYVTGTLFGEQVNDNI